jgi:hypothetical protein
MLPLYKVIKSDHLIEKTTTLGFSLKTVYSSCFCSATNNQLTPCSRFLLEKLTFLQLVNQIRRLWNPKVHGYIKKIQLRDFALREINSVHINPSHVFKIYLSFPSLLGVPNGLCPPTFLAPSFSNYQNVLCTYASENVLLNLPKAAALPDPGRLDPSYVYNKSHSNVL